MGMGQHCPLLEELKNKMMSHNHGTVVFQEDTELNQHRGSDVS